MQQEIAAAYISLCDAEMPIFNSYLSSLLSQLCNSSSLSQNATLYVSFSKTKLPLAIFASKKYKPVALKIHPIEMELPT